MKFWLASAFLLAACAEDDPTPKLRKDPAAPPAPSREEPEAGPNVPMLNDAGPSIMETYLSDLDVLVISSGYGPVERNMSNGDIGEKDGNPITLMGVTYPKGLGVHADSEIIVALNGGYQSFISDVGVDDEVGERGSVVFRVMVDGALAFDSGVMTGATPTKKVELDVTGKRQLKLLVTNNGDVSYDHADWAGARLTR